MYLYSRLYGVVNGRIFIAKCMQQSRKVISRHLLYIASQSQQWKEIHTIGSWEVTKTLRRPFVTAKVASPLPKHLYFFFEVYGVHVSPKKLLVHSLKICICIRDSMAL